MRIGGVYSHQNGLEYLTVHKPDLLNEIYEVIGHVDATICRTKESRERTMIGRMLYSPAAMNQQFKDLLNERGWTEDRTTYYCCNDEDLTRRIVHLEPLEQKRVIEESGRVALPSFNQTDFLKERTAIEIQFGKYSFVAFDLFIKHMGFFVADKISVGIEILPMKSLQDQMSSGPSYYERELQHIIRQGRGNPPVPLVLIGIEP